MIEAVAARRAFRLVLIKPSHYDDDGYVITDPTPSTADVQMTKSIMSIAGPLGISVHDHIIVGKNGHASLKGLRLM